MIITITLLIILINNNSHRCQRVRLPCRACSISSMQSLTSSLRGAWLFCCWRTKKSFWNRQATVTRWETVFQTPELEHVVTVASTKPPDSDTERNIHLRNFEPCHHFHQTRNTTNHNGRKHCFDYFLNASNFPSIANNRNFRRQP